jgi:hypothetical protein
LHDFVLHELDSGLKLVLKQDDSIAILASRDNGSIVNDLLTENYVNLSPMLGETPKEVLNAFDDNIEYLRTTDDPSNGIQLPQGPYVLCICEGTAEEAIIDLLLDNDMLQFSRSQLINNHKVTRIRKVRDIETQFLNIDYSDRGLIILRILDSKRVFQGNLQGQYSQTRIVYPGILRRSRQIVTGNPAVSSPLRAKMNSI